MENNFDPNENISRSRNAAEPIPETNEIFEEIEFVKIVEDKNLALSDHEDHFNCN